jgi:hypothetical protein
MVWHNRWATRGVAHADDNALIKIPTTKPAALRATGFLE